MILPVHCWCYVTYIFNRVEYARTFTSFENIQLIKEAGVLLLTCIAHVEIVVNVWVKRGANISLTLDVQNQNA